MPKRRAASRWLSPSTWQAWRTRPYSSTENIPAFPGPFRTSQGKATPRYSLVPPRPDYPAASVAHHSSAALNHVSAKHAQSYLTSFAYRFNRRFQLDSIVERLAWAATRTAPQLYRVIVADA